MEFYLTKAKHVEMRPVANERRKVSTSNIEIQLEPAVKPINHSEGSYYCKLLATSLVGNAYIPLSSSLKGDEICSYVTLDLTLPKSNEDNNGSIRIFSSGDVKGSGVSGANIFERFGNVLGYEGVKVNVKLDGFHYAGDPENKLNIVKHDLEITTLTGQCDGCECTEVEFPANMRGPWDGRLTFSGDLTVSVTLNDDAVSLLYLEQFYKWEHTKNNKVTLEEAIFSDLVIVASNGAEVKCHKSYLAVCSDVFKAMFESQMKETLTNSIKMDDMSEPGARAFLAFIYYWDMKAASKDCDIAYELYCAGHKYAITDLEIAIGKLICAKSNEWFNVDMTVKLLLFTKNVKDDDNEGAEDLFKKSLQILKWFNKSPVNLFNSVEYQQLFQKNQKVAMEVSSYFLAWDK